MNRIAPFVLAAIVTACGSPEPPPAPPRVVSTIVATPGNPGRDVLSGEVRARVETDLAFRVGGKVAQRLVDAGARVEAGQPLARLDPDDAARATDAARAQLAAAEADLALANAELERAKDLLAKRFISASAFDARQTAQKAAAARADQARAQAALSGNQQGYTTLVADAPGVVLSTAIEPGQVVAAGQPAMRLARDGAREVLVHVPESQVARVKPGLPALVTLWAATDAPLPARIREVAGGADPVTRTFAVRVSVLQPPPAMRPGMTASVLLGEGGAAPIVVPLPALDRQGEEAAVWIVEAKDSTVRRRVVKVAQYREDGAALATGLAAGERIVSAGVHKLREGERVRIDKPPGN